jgi:phage shock protein E
MNYCLNTVENKSQQALFLFFSLIFCLLLAAGACGISRSDRNFVLEESYLLIDVRNPEEFAQSHLTGATNIPYTKIEHRIDQLTNNYEQQIILYCRSGRRSEIARKTLTKMGFTNLINAGGFSKLQRSGILARP